MARTSDSHLRVETAVESLSIGVVHVVVVHNEIEDHLLFGLPFVGEGVEDDSVELGVRGQLVDVVVLVKRVVDLVVEGWAAFHVFEEERG